MNFGTVKVQSSSRGDYWAISCEPHVRNRLRRVFPQVSQSPGDTILLSMNPENARDLLWFTERYPMGVDKPTTKGLKQLARAHEETESAVQTLLSAISPPEDFELALPARDYQKLAASLLQLKSGLLLADDVGLGKTVSAICSMCRKDNLPVLVVTLTHLPEQWAAEIAKFAPELKVHILKSGKTYPLVKVRKGDQSALFEDDVDRMPDVIISNYHKLNGWAETLAGVVKYVVFDEAQELRHDSSNKYVAAKHIAGKAKLRIGLSATPIYNMGNEFFNVLEILAPGALGTYEEFHREWCGEEGVIKDPKAFGAYLRREGLMLRRTRKDVGRELPPFSNILQTIQTDQKVLDQIKSSAVELAKVILASQQNYRGEKFQASEEFNMLLRQSTGIAKAPYVAEFVRMLMASEEKVVLFGWHRACFARGTKALMFDGTSKEVENVAVGDLLMGPDSKPREVKNLTRGNGQMFRIVPNKGAPWVCSEHHILTVRNTNGTYEKHTAGDYARHSPRWQRDRTLYRAEAIEFPATSTVLEPWFMGYWIGDGSASLRSGLRVSSADAEVYEEMCAIAARYGLSVTSWPSKGASGKSECLQHGFTSGASGPKNRNQLLQHWRSLDLCGKKRVHHSYATASVSDRRELLAGLIDSDGHVYRGNGVGSADYVCNGRELADEVAFVARSLGFAAYVVEKHKSASGYQSNIQIHYIVRISGDLTTLPMRVARKKAGPRAGQKNVLRTGFTIEDAGTDDFYGFEVDDDHLFLLDDFTVVHNCYDIYMDLLADFKPVLYTGTESAKQKQSAKDAFVHGDSRIMIISLRAGAGLDGLQKVCRVGVFGEIDWSPGVHIQCGGRYYRDGQDEPSMAYYLLSEDGSDPVIADLLGLKKGQIEGVVDPDADLVEQLAVEPGSIKKLAKVYLQKLGVTLPEAEKIDGELLAA